MKHFRGNSERTSLFSPKSDFLRKENRKTHKFVFLNMFENRQTLRKIWICLNNCFWSNQWKGTNIKQKLFFSPMSNIQLNYALLLFWSILEEIHRELLFLDQKVTFSERRTEILTNFFFLNMFENGQILRKIRICLNNSFWSNQWKGTNIKKICFSPHTEPHTVKLCFSVVLKFFRKFTENFSF